jgi:hypothetical protein
MADHRPKIPIDTRRTILREAGNKCANPGCANRVTEIHHIKEWHIYHSHDAEHMIAICPSCHGGVDRGGLTIDDETLYRWKTIRRTEASTRGHIYIEPGDLAPKLVLGTISVQSETAFVVFELGKYSNLEFCVRGEQILIPRLRVGTNDGPIIDVIDGHVMKKDRDVEFRSRAGKVLVTDAALRSRIPAWALGIAANDPDINLSSQPLLDLEVIGPGLLKVQGVWLSEDFIVIITNQQLSFIYPGLIRPKSMVGAGDGTKSVLKVVGPSILFAAGRLTR